MANFITCGQYAKHLQTTRKLTSVNAYAYRNFLFRNLPKNSAISFPSGGLVLFVQMADLDDIKLKAFTKHANIDIRFGAQFTSRKLCRDYLKLNIAWGLSEMNDSQRSIERALLQLTVGVHKALRDESRSKVLNSQVKPTN